MIKAVFLKNGSGNWRMSYSRERKGERLRGVRKEILWPSKRKAVVNEGRGWEDAQEGK